MTDEEKLKVLSDAQRDIAAGKPSKYTSDQISAQIDRIKTKPAPTTFADQMRMTHQAGEGAAATVPGASHEGEVDPQDTRLHDFNERLSHLGRGVQTLGHATIHPIETISSPSKRREMVRGLDDMVTLGYGQKASDALTAYLKRKGVSDEVIGLGNPNDARSMGDMAASDAKLAPNYRTAGSIVGAFSPGATSYVARQAAPVGAALAARAGLPGALGGAVGAGVGYELSAPALAAASAGASGDRLGAAKEAAIDPLGLLLAGIGGGIGGAGRAKAAKIRDPKTMSGRTIQDVGDAKIKMFGEEPVKGGIYNSPELRDVGPGREGVNDLAGKTVDRIRGINKGRLKTANTDIGDTINSVIAEHSDTPVQTPEAHSRLDKMEAENRLDNGMIRDAQRQAALEDVRARLTQPTGGTDIDATVANVNANMRPDMRFKPEFLAKMSPEAKQAFIDAATPEQRAGAPARQVTARDLIALRSDLRGKAFAAKTQAEKRVYEQVIEGLNADAEKLDPRIKELNAKYASAMVPIETSNDMVFGKKRKTFPMNEAARTTAVQRLGTMTDDTQSATNRQLADRLAALGPDYERQVQLMRAKKAQERLRRGEPQTSTALEKQTASAARGVARGRTIGAILAGVPGYIAGFGIDKLRENPLPNQVRVTLPISETIGKANGMIGVRGDAVTAAARRRAKKKRNQGAEDATGR